jgi:uncharacterized membrane protein YqiK
MKVAALLISLVGSVAAFSATAPSDVDRTVVRKAIMRLNKDNFSSTLSMVEPFLVNEAGITFYEKAVRNINRNAKTIGVEVPAGFAKDAKATSKRRAKQDAFVQAKIAAAAEAVAAAEAAAAAAAEAEAAAAAAAAEAPAAEETPQ